MGLTLVLFYECFSIPITLYVIYIHNVNIKFKILLRLLSLFEYVYLKTEACDAGKVNWTVILIVNIKKGKKIIK